MKLVLVLVSLSIVLLHQAAANLPEETTTETCSMEEMEQDNGTLQQGNPPREVAVCQAKAFYVGRSMMSWVDSIAYCYDQGLIPGSVEDKAEFDCVAKGSWESGYNSWWFWTSGNELAARASPRQFTWFPSGIPLNRSGGFRVVLSNPKDRCIAFDISGHQGVKSWLNDWNCRLEGFPLCERKLPCCSCTVG